MTGACPDMNLFHVPPPAFPSRHLTLSIEPKSKNTLRLVFSGNTKPFQDGFVKGGFRLASVPMENDVHHQYFRVKETVNLSDVTTFEDWKTFCGEDGLLGAPILVRLKGEQN
eukprot:1345601-Karenia_brevis.AAC.1